MCFRPPTLDTEPLTCPKCGAANPPDAQECVGCGAKAEAPKIAPPPSASAPPKVPSVPKAASVPSAPVPKPKP